MQDQFNLASLAKLSKSELEALLASYLSMLIASSSEAERQDARAKIVAVRMALEMM